MAAPGQGFAGATIAAKRARARDSTPAVATDRVDRAALSAPHDLPAGAPPQRLDAEQRSRQHGTTTAAFERQATEPAMTAQPDREVATLGGGCFWCLEAIYKDLKGVERVVSGYAGGQLANPTYEQVCGGRTGHAEVVQITYDPRVVSFRDLLDVFFTIHDPTTRDRQGADVGPQYRSIVLYHDAGQQAEAERAIAEVGAKRIWRDPIVTEVVPLEMFYPAEAYHQDYYEQNRRQRYCQIVIAPKVAKFRQQFLAKLKQ
jgi:peptide-methionine (S)-S-oxide reductase